MGRSDMLSDNRAFVARALGAVKSSKEIEYKKQRIFVKSSNVGKDGKCLFDFKYRKENEGIAVCIVNDADARTGGVYVIPMHRCPEQLLVIPGGHSKWSIFESSGVRRSGDLKALVDNLLISMNRSRKVSLKFEP